MTGRPSDYSESLAALICARMAEGESLRSICRDPDMPCLASIFLWIGKYPAFSEQYTRAMDARAAAMEQDILEIADDGRNDTYEVDGVERTDQDVIARSRLRVDTRKWLMARMAPKKYGDRVTQTIEGGDPAKPVQTLTRIELVAAPFPERVENDEGR